MMFKLQILKGRNILLVQQTFSLAFRTEANIDLRRFDMDGLIWQNF